MRSILPALLALALLPAVGRADGTISTAPTDQAPPTAAVPPPLADSASGNADEDPSVVIGPCGPQKVGANGVPETKPHGYAEVGVGTRGYRHVALGVCKPLKDGGAVAIDVSESQEQGRVGRR